MITKLDEEMLVNRFLFTTVVELLMEHATNVQTDCNDPIDYINGFIDDWKDKTIRYDIASLEEFLKVLSGNALYEPLKNEAVATVKQNTVKTTEMATLLKKLFEAS